MSAMHRALNSFVQANLTLSASQISQGSTSHTYIRGLLSNKSEHDAAFPRLVDGDFLSGSYKRGTKIFPLDDIDLMMVLDGDGLYAISNGQVLNADVRGSGQMANPIMQHLGFDGRLSSQVVLNLFLKALQRSHPNSKIKPSGQAVNVALASGIGIDVVPCFHIQPRDGAREHYYIPLGHGEGGWLTTNPKLDEEITEIFNNRHNGLFKGLVRLLKHWNRNFNAGRLRSHHIETLAWWAFDNYQGSFEYYDVGLLHFFRSAQTLLQNLCPDGTGLGGPVDLYLTQEDRAASCERVSQTIRMLTAGYVAGGQILQLRAWRAVLGEQVKFAA